MSATLSVALDNEGFLLDRDDWSEEVAVELAQSDGFEMTEQVMHFIREARAMYEEDGVVPPIRLFAKIVQIQPDILKTCVLKEFIEKRDDLKISLGGLVDDLRADLMELPFATRLRAFGAEHGAHIIKPERLSLFQKAFFDHRTGDRGGHFGTQSHIPFSAILE